MRKKIFYTRVINLIGQANKSVHFYSISCCFGFYSDLDRLPMLTWIMFLKFADDLKLQREDEAKLAGKKLKPAIEPPYRWRDCAVKSDCELEFALPDVVKVPPISHRGTPMEIATIFGRPDKLRTTVAQLQTFLYSANQN